jgi:hypothetical protein
MHRKLEAADPCDCEDEDDAVCNGSCEGCTICDTEADEEAEDIEE